MQVTWHNMLLSLPVLLAHLALTTGLFIGGLSLYVYLAPYRELKLVREGNVAAATVLAGQTLGLAIPLAAMMANSITAMGVGLWGLIAIALQYIAILSVRLAVPRLGDHISRGDVAVALVLAVAQVSAGILNAAAMSG